MKIYRAALLTRERVDGHGIKMLSGFAVEADPVNKDKVERAEPLLLLNVLRGMSVIRNPKWNAAYLAVMTAFPCPAR